jgi:hypothetical protein
MQRNIKTVRELAELTAVANELIFYVRHGKDTYDLAIDPVANRNENLKRIWQLLSSG